MSEVLEVKYMSYVFYVKFSDGFKAFLRYGVEDGKMLLLETYTPPQHRGRGVAKLLVDKALELAREMGLKVVPICSYSINYFIRSPNLRDILAEPYRSMREEELIKYYKERLKIEVSKK